MSNLLGAKMEINGKLIYPMPKNYTLLTGDWEMQIRRYLRERAIVSHSYSMNISKMNAE